MHSLLQKVVQKKKLSSPITMVTAYDYPTARMEELAGIDVLLVGDSVGTNVLGYDNECEVTMDDMMHHLKAVVRGAPESCIMVDMPFGSAVEPQSALENAKRLLGAGAHMVKIEGWEEKKTIVSFLSQNGIPVCSHIGYNPQYHGPKGRVFGKETSVAVELIQSAKQLEAAGAVMLIAEKIPEQIGKIISLKLSVPVIGIGSGRYCDGQVLVFHDIVGLGWRSFRHARAFADIRKTTETALAAYVNEVKERKFPSEEHSWRMNVAVLDEVVRLTDEV
jgi:3-methyl-2-oxobutanoate hydroxymethyltransferase